MLQPPNWARAAMFAARAHRHQLRKDGQTPYVAHLYRVAFTVRHVFVCEDELAIQIALLHDTIEDTTTDFDELALEFGEEVARGVAYLTKDSRLPEAEREARYFENLHNSPWQVRLVKLADTYDNLSDCFNEAMRKKMLGKLRQAWEIPGDEPQLKLARAIVEAVLQERS